MGVSRWHTQTDKQTDRQTAIADSRLKKGLPRGQAGRPAQGPGHGPAGEGEEGEGGPLAAAHQGPQGPAEGPVPGDLNSFPILKLLCLQAIPIRASQCCKNVNVLATKFVL